MTQRHQHLITTTAEPSTCPRCRQPILFALDEGLPARVDVQPIAQADEPAVLLSGRWTYTRLRLGDLAHRDADRIRGNPPGPIHAQHHCRRSTR